MGPVHQVRTLHQHHAAVAAPSVAGAHVGNHHVEGLAVFASEDMWVSHTLGEGDGVAADDGETAIERGVVVAVIAEGITDLFFFRSVAREIREEIGHVLLLLLGVCHGHGNSCRCGQKKFLHVLSLRYE